MNREFFRPFGILKIGEGWYLRSPGVWNFDSVTYSFALPVGIGFGSVIFTEPAMLKVFFEPQVTIASEGSGQRERGEFLGINFQSR